VGGVEDSSLTRVQPVFGAALDRDATGSSWLPRLLAATPRGRDALGSVVDNPGVLSSRTLEPSPSKKASLRCFEQQVPPDRRLLSWCVEHPGMLVRPLPSDAPSEAEKLRRNLICDEPAGSRKAAQRRARRLVAHEPVGQRAWWRFERSTEVDCVLATDRLVLCVEGKRNERLSKGTTWLASRHQVARNLEAAWRLAGSDRAFAVLVCVETLGDPIASVGFVIDSLEESSPHLFAAERTSLGSAYLGEITWASACDALGLDATRLPKTVADLPASLRSSSLAGPVGACSSRHENAL
jgi:hypothetical protein